VLFTGHTLAAAFDNASIEVLSLKTGQRKTVQRGGYFGRYVPSGHLVYIHQGTLFAVGFDLDRLEVRGTPAPLLQDVAGNAATGGGHYDVVKNATLVYLSGKSSAASWQVAWMESSGRTQPLLAAPSQYYMPRFSPDGKRLALVVRSAAGDDIQVYDSVDRAYVLAGLKENFERAMQHRPVLDAKGNETGIYAYNGQVANRALELIGKELGMFVERNTDVPWDGDPAKLTDGQLETLLSEG